MSRYYVVRRTKEKDEEFAVIDALSLDEANAIFEVRYKDFKETMQKRRGILYFSSKRTIDVWWESSGRVSKRKDGNDS